MVDIAVIVAKYIELRDRKEEMAKKQSEEMAPLNEAQGNIENYLMHLMNQMGVDQVKAGGVGTAFKSTATSCQMADPAAFKQFVFSPVIDGVVNYMRATGIGLQEKDIEHLKTIMLSMPMWDMIDFRAGKKGIVEYVANEGTVPGVTINTIATVKVRRVS